MKKVHFLVSTACLLLFMGLLGSCETGKVSSKKLSLVPLFSNHMVLQQQAEVAFWGTYTPKGKVTVSSNWGEEASAVTDEEGNWKLKLPTPKAGGPFELNITTNDSIISLKDVLVGEVWLASGQSNMQMPLEGFLPSEPIINYKEEIAAADYPNIRYFDVVRAISPTPENSFVGEWNATSPETANNFSASAYFFARKLHQDLNVPIGIINSNWGGTPVESWMSRGKMLQLEEFKEELSTLEEENIAKIKAWFSKFPTVSVPTTPEEWDVLNLDDEIYRQPDFDDASWPKVKLPGFVEDIPNIRHDGVFWFRKTIQIEDISTDYTLTVSEGIDDMDVSYINGEKIGSTMGWNTPRAYIVPKSILVKGENTIAIRVIDTGGGGGFSGEMQFKSESGTEIPINNEWQLNHIADIQASNFLLYHTNPDAYNNQPAELASYKFGPRSPSVLYNAMIHPMIPYSIKGAIWYQGESNVGRADQYLKLFPGMIEDWRTRWNYDFPFYFVQIAPFTYGNELSPLLRDTQRKSLKAIHTGMAVTMDIGHPTSIHPGNKQDVGDRLARLALANDYEKDIIASGPLYKSHTLSENKIIIEFDYADGLMIKDSKSTEFEIAGADKKYVPAKVNIVGDKVEVSAPSVSQPEYARYAWKDYVVGTLFNKADLPASSFTTEE